MNGISSQEMYGTDQAIAITNRSMWQVYHNRAEDGLVEVAPGTVRLAFGG